MFSTIKQAFKVKDIRIKIFFTLLILVIYRIGCYVPVPGINTDVFSNAIESNTFLELMNSVTGGALAQGTLFALGIGPYINASIIIQLLCVGIPSLERLSKQGEEGKKKIALITRIITLVLAIIQSLGIILAFGVAQDANSIENTIFLFLKPDSGWTKALVWTFMTIIYTSGAMVVMWLGERITEHGVGNGISMVIFIGIISTAGLAIINEFKSAFTNGFHMMHIWYVIIFIAVTIVLFTLITWVDLAERKITVQYAKQLKGRKMYGGQSTVIPMKITGNGVMPLIFAFAIISLPDLIMSMVPAWNGAAQAYQEWFSGGNGPLYWLYVIVLCLLIFAFAFFYSQIQFNPEDVSRSIQQNGGFIAGIRPGRPTAAYLKKINNRITLFGAIFLSLVAFIPTMILGYVLPQNGTPLLNAFSTTGILIVVSVALEIEKQLQAQLMMKTYKGFL